MTSTPSYSHTLAIDIETYSDVDLRSAGVFRYAESPDFEVLLIAYSIGDDMYPRVIDLTETELPKELKDILTDGRYLKTAYNAPFEIACLSTYLGIQLDPAQWECTMVKALTLGYSGTLAQVGAALGLPDYESKSATGTRLINYFSKPHARTSGKITRNSPQDAPDKWEQFKRYCVQDVVAEKAIRKRLEAAPVGYDRLERELWLVDQKVNTRGIPVDAGFVTAAIDCAENDRDRLLDRARELTGLDNPNSITQLKSWLASRGHEVETLDKASVETLLSGDLEADVAEVLHLRASLGKTSVKKYRAMQHALCADGRVRGLLQFYGAGRTGRWAGRLVQVQNLPQNHLPDLDLARTLVAERRFGELKLIFGDIQDVLSQLVRTAFVAPEGMTFAVADFSAIEARIIAWLAGESWREEVFATHGRIYEASAAQMFKVPIAEVTKGSPLRQKGKIAELALGYGGSAGALRAMGALKMGLDESELLPLVDAWRAANRHIVAFWWEVDEAARQAVEQGGRYCIGHGIWFSVRGDTLFVRLPSGRELAYVRPRLAPGRYGKPVLTYEGANQTTCKWERIETYGPKLTENIVQATARDCLGAALRRLHKRGMPPVMHVHDEVIVCVPKEDARRDLARIKRWLTEGSTWCMDLPLACDGYLTDYYKKG
jgi:DNA polymerase